MSEVRYKITLDEKVSGKLSKLEKRNSGLNSSFKRLGATMLATFGASKIMAAFSSTLDAYDKQAQAVAQVEQGILSSGQAAGRTLDQLTADATKLQNVSLFGDEDILQNSTAQLLTFTNIAGKEFDRTQQATLDLTTRLNGAGASGEQLKSVSIQLGKALNDPVANLSALSRSGIQFSKEQKTTIKTLVETNKLAEAQGIILDELEKQYGGSAKAAARAGTGGLKQLKNTLGDIQEELGAKTQGALKSTTSLFKSLADTALDYVAVPVSRELEIEKTKFNRLTKEIKNANVPFSEKQELIAEAQRIYPGYLKNVTSEEELQAGIAEATREGNIYLNKQIKLKKVRAELSFQENELENQLADQAAFQRKADELNTEESEKQKFNTAKNYLQKAANLSNSIHRALGVDLDFMNKITAEGNKQAVENLDKTTLAKQNAINATMLRLKKLETQLESVDADIPLETNIKQGDKKELQSLVAAAPKVFNITIDKLVETFNVNSATISEGSASIKDKIIEVFADAINDVQIIAN